MLTFGPCIFQAIVDAALRHGRPFAVVPCCVYRSAFAPRYLRSGEVVVSLAHFCRYLLEKVHSHPRALASLFAAPTAPKATTAASLRCATLTRNVSPYPPSRRHQLGR